MSKESAMAALTGNPTPSPLINSEAQPAPAPQLASTPFNLLAKKEATLLKARQEFKKEQDAIAAEKDKYLQYNKRVEDFEKTRLTDPVAAMKMIGFTETEIFNYLAAQEKKEPTPEERAALAASEAAEAKIKAFEDAQNKRIKDEQTKQDVALIQEFRADLGKTIESDPVKFEYCNYYANKFGLKAVQDVLYETALEVLKVSKEVISPIEAAQMVEEYYEEEDKLMSQLKKRSPLAAAPIDATQPTRTRTVHPPAGQVVETPKPTITKTRTLTNGVTSTVASTRHRMNETKEQKRDRLIEALRNGAKL